MRKRNESETKGKQQTREIREEGEKTKEGNKEIRM
jgi:hypothetical protein